MIRTAACAPGEVMDLLRGALSAKTDSQSQFTVEGLVAQGQCFKVTDEGGAIVAAYVLQPVGAVLWILIAAGRAEFDLTRAITALVSIQGRQFDYIGFRTERPGLVRKARREGFTITGAASPGYYMRKSLR